MTSTTKIYNTFSILNTKGLALGLMILLTLLYLAAGIITLIEMTKHLRFFLATTAHSQTTKKIRGFRVVILFISAWFMIHQGCISMFGFSSNHLYVLFIVAYAIPFYLQFCSYILLTWLLGIIRYATISNQKAIKKVLNPIFIVVLIISFGLLLFSGNYYSNEKMQFVVSGFIFLLLVLFLGTSAYLFYRFITRLSMSFQSRSRVKIFMNLIIFNSTLFLLRAIYDFINVGTTKIIDWSTKDDNTFFPFYFVWMIIFEILPVVVLVLAFHMNISNEMGRKGSLTSINTRYHDIEDDEDESD
ncbi:hypothetical protein M0811_11937 [Anaeramoeba ignava]|uniref:Uncharacterized protein n=1 Tax=Anaeramoeba ignava TaxID=1746090 RepID=A0A9Q0L9Y6_ANAIG|nr:hypothetical protein M0811_11937 [Anaeramoeba ignava]